MPIVNTNDAPEVEDSLKTILESTDDERRIDAIRSLFVEVLDYEQDNQPIALNASSDYLPTDARLVAHRDGVYAVYITLGSSRVTGQVATEAARSLSSVLGDDLLMLFTNGDCDQFHIIRPDFSGSRPILNRMVVRKGERHRTIAQQIAGMWESYGRQGKTIHEAIRAAFSVEPVTRDFFRAYKDIFKDTESKIAGFGNDADGVEDKHRFTQMLFNRLMFIYFVSRKGWLTFNGDPDYLNALWKAYGSTRGDVNFYDTRLAPLFFEGLNNPKAPDLIRDNPELYAAIGDVKFLNGGLFEKNELDKRSGIVVQDDAIEPILSRLFDRFNFTVMESTPYDTEVAVDPEMLGKVFEELVTGRHESGAYYTPRPVVAFMCREALKGYLAGQATGLTEDVITAFVDSQNTVGISVPDARKVASALEQVTVVDPACGSGAYLLGMMQELIELQTILFNVVADSKSIYDLKLEIIQRNLYGVDIDEFAVNIAMLRLWLSLAIDYDGNDPEPLPNLGFKIACGDSLLAPDPSSQSYGNIFRNFVQDLNLGEMKAEYMRATELADKERWRTEITAAREQIKATLGDAGVQEDAVDWRVEFAEVIGERGGFDIVVANPPYVQLQKDSGRLGRLYRDAGYKTFVRSGDIYQLFYERGCQMLKPSVGLLAYITSNSWLKAEYGKRSRRYFSEQHTPLILLELGKDVFESAIVDSSVLLMREGRTNDAPLTFDAVDIERLDTNDFPPHKSLWGQARLDTESPWSILSRIEQSVMDKMQTRGIPLKDWDVKINRGITTGYNKAFIMDDSTKDALITKDPNSTEIIKPIMRGRDIQRYLAQPAGLWLIYSHSNVAEDDYPAVREHLLAHKQRLLKRRGGANSRTGRVPYQWWQLQVDYYNSGAYKDFAKEKLFWMDMSPRGRFAYSDNELYCNDKGFILTGASLKYICAILNSSIITWLMKSTALTTGMGLMQWKKFAVQRLPIPKISAAKQRPFTRLVDEIIQAKAANPDADTGHLEIEIDDLVYDLYGLSEAEETAIERSLGLIHTTDEEEDAAIARAIDEEMALTDARVNIEEVKEMLRERDEARK